MALWRIKAYRLAGNFCPIQEWYAVQDVEVQAEFDAAIATLSATADWSDTWLFKELTKKHVGLGEIRFKLEGPPVRRFRPVGIWPPIVQGEFILLLGCEKTRNVYMPRDAFTLALEYKRRWERGEGEVYDYV